MRIKLIGAFVVVAILAIAGVVAMRVGTTEARVTSNTEQRGALYGDGVSAAARSRRQAVHRHSHDLSSGRRRRRRADSARRGGQRSRGQSANGRHHHRARRRRRRRPARCGGHRARSFAGRCHRVHRLAAMAQARTSASQSASVKHTDTTMTAGANAQAMGSASSATPPNGSSSRIRAT